MKSQPVTAGRQGQAVELSVDDLGRVYLIGIGGVGMSAVARLLLGRGVTVSGSELKEWPVLAGLREMGATIYPAHDAANLASADTVVYSTAIPEDHPEYVEARRLGLRMLHRSQALAAVMHGRDTIAVAGSHGKTTTSSLTAFILQHSGMDPSYVIGGEIAHNGSNAHAGAGREFVIEADESDNSFLSYRPRHVVLTNAGNDHVTAYGNVEALHDAFYDFVRSMHPDGFLVACADDTGSAELANRARQDGRTVYTYGESPAADFRMTDLTSSLSEVSYTAELDGEVLGQIRIPSPGRHLGLNSGGAALTTLRMGLPFDAVAAALAAFPGVVRRLEHKGTWNGVRVYDEYSFHPRSMTAALTTMRSLAGDGRLIVAFQPLRLARTEAFQAEIAEALSIADDAIVMDIFDPSLPAPAVDVALSLVEQIGLPADRKVYARSWDQVPAEVVRRAQPGDVVLTMGAPPISLMASDIKKAIMADVSV